MVDPTADPPPPEGEDTDAASSGAPPPKEADKSSSVDTAVQADDNVSYIHTKKDDFVMSFEDLTCYVPGIPQNCCVSADNPITNYLEYYMGMQVQERDPFYSLDGCSGYIKSGEMCLVLGSNDQSKSTLLRALCGRLNSQDELYGTVLLNGMPLGRSNQGWVRSYCVLLWMLVYMMNAHIHIHTLFLRDACRHMCRQVIHHILPF